MKKRSHTGLYSISIHIILIVLFATSSAIASKPKLMIVPIKKDSALNAEDSKYLTDSMFEAASLRVEGQIALIPMQQTNAAIKKTGKKCKNSCIFKAAKKTEARIALSCDLTSHKDKTVGFVNLLDANDKSVLSAKRFIIKGNKLKSIESGLKAAVFYVLKAKYLPLSKAQQTVLARTQEGTPHGVGVEAAPVITGPKISKTEAAEFSVAPAQTADETAVNNQNDSNIGNQASPDNTTESSFLNDAPDTNSTAALQDTSADYTNMESPSAMPPNTRKKNALLVSAIILDTVGVGMTIGGIIFLKKAGDEIDDYNTWVDVQLRYETVINDPATQPEDKQKYSDLWYEAEDKKNVISDTVKSNNVAGGVLLGVGGAAFLASIFLWVKYSKINKTTKSNTLTINPVITPEYKGTFLTASF